METSSPLTYFLAFISEIKVAFFYSLRRESSKYCIKLLSIVFKLLSSFELTFLTKGCHTYKSFNTLHLGTHVLRFTPSSTSYWLSAAASNIAVGSSSPSVAYML